MEKEKSFIDIIEATDNLEIIKWLQNKKLIPDIKYCTKCENQKLAINARNDVIDKYCW